MASAEVCNADARLSTAATLSSSLVTFQVSILVWLLTSRADSATHDPAVVLGTCAASASLCYARASSFLSLLC